MRFWHRSVRLRFRHIVSYDMDGEKDKMPLARRVCRSKPYLLASKPHIYPDTGDRNLAARNLGSGTFRPCSVAESQLRRAAGSNFPPIAHARSRQSEPHHLASRSRAT
eukprot:694704-Rhodomonas_salina.1